MSITPASALQLLEKYISQLEAAKGLPHHIGNPSYDGAIHGATALLTELFGDAEAKGFLERIATSRNIVESNIKGREDLSVVYKSVERNGLRYSAAPHGKRAGD